MVDIATHQQFGLNGSPTQEETDQHRHVIDRNLVVMVDITILPFGGRFTFIIHLVAACRQRDALR